jgi:hypothetical protein
MSTLIVGGRDNKKRQQLNVLFALYRRVIKPTLHVGSPEFYPNAAYIPIPCFKSQATEPRRARENGTELNLAFDPNGRRVNSCLTLGVMHDDDEITTIEGLASATIRFSTPTEFRLWRGCG